MQYTTMAPNYTLIERDGYLDDLKAFRSNGNAKIVTGVHRCGKSTLLDILSSRSESSDNVVSMNMELAQFSDISDWKSLLAYVEKRHDPDKYNMLIIDEVQNIPEWELAIRDLIARDMYDIYITGSNANLLSSEYATHLGGRYNSIRMLPLSYRECMRFSESFKIEGDVFERFIRIGGFPILWKSQIDDRNSMATIRDIVDVIVYKDIGGRYSVRNLSLLWDIFKTVLSTEGSYVSSNNIFNTLRSSGVKASPDTVSQYIQHLESANLIIRADVFDIKGRRILESKHKYYATDLGIKHAVLGYRQKDIAGHMENIIFTELMHRGYDVYVGDYKGKEIDVIGDRFGERIYVQACTGITNEDTYLREFGNLECIPDSHPKYVVMMDPGIYRGTSESGIRCCSLQEFLEMDGY